LLWFVDVVVVVVIAPRRMTAVFGTRGAHAGTQL